MVKLGDSIPISVLRPVPMTMPRHLPAAMFVPCKQHVRTSHQLRLYACLISSY